VLNRRTGESSSIQLPSTPVDLSDGDGLQLPSTPVDLSDGDDLQVPSTMDHPDEDEICWSYRDITGVLLEQ